MFREIEVCDSIVSVAESITPAKSNFDFEKGKMIKKQKNPLFPNGQRGMSKLTIDYGV